ECLDHHVGRLLDHLEARGQTDNTLVMITSDNGPWFEGSTGGLRGRKIDTYEGGIKMPFLARWPARIAPGSTCATPSCFIDLMPTLANLTGASMPEDRPIDGIDLTSCLLGGDVAERTLHFFSHWHLNAVRRGRWKLHVDRFPSTDLRELPQLFDLEADPAENYNLASLHPGVLADLQERRDAFAAEIAAQQAEAERRAPREPPAPVIEPLAPVTTSRAERARRHRGGGRAAGVRTRDERPFKRSAQLLAVLRAARGQRRPERMVRSARDPVEPEQRGAGPPAVRAELPVRRRTEAADRLQRGGRPGRVR